VDDVRSLLDTLDPYKATGPDNITTQLLKETAKQMAPILTQASLDQGNLPFNWKTTNITKEKEQTLRIIDLFP